MYKKSWFLLTSIICNVYWWMKVGIETETVQDKTGTIKIWYNKQQI